MQIEGRLTTDTNTRSQPAREPTSGYCCVACLALSNSSTNHYSSRSTNTEKTCFIYTSTRITKPPAVQHFFVPSRKLLCSALQHFVCHHTKNLPLCNTLQHGTPPDVHCYCMIRRYTHVRVYTYVHIIERLCELGVRYRSHHESCQVRKHLLLLQACTHKAKQKNPNAKKPMVESRTGHTRAYVYIYTCKQTNGKQGAGEGGLGWALLG